MASVLARLGPQASVGCGFAVGVGAASALVHALGAHGTDVHTAGQFAVAILGVVTVGAWIGAEWGLLAGAGRRPPGAAYELVAKGPDDVERAAAAAPPGSPTRGSRRRRGRAWRAGSTATCCEQTEEWKGWMQLMFLLYHYFAQGQLYNAIRIYIAGYVWMTGYGNFLYYRKSGDFSAVRMCQTIFRLNFFVVVVCVALRNEYMLYYIAPMHTLFTLFVWLALRVAKDRSGDDAVAAGKIVATLAATALLYDVEPVFKAAFGWRPLRDLVAFHDPLHQVQRRAPRVALPQRPRPRIWIFGMACALGLPYLERRLGALAALDDGARRVAAHGAAACVALAPAVAWVALVFLKDKYAYNALHPYTSWVPVACYIVLRNLTPGLRSKYLHLHVRQGHAETYILQFHIWMKTTGLNGAPTATTPGASRSAPPPPVAAAGHASRAPPVA
ncbi:N-acetylneuraminate 7-O(or 9-O)-acetyltransferase [Aureococcus anophagefferens]|nr:N-acetylneuraminate 7-O(or 9-O)-acetyltransferase [Aureococcus anophagefferens]